MCLELLVFNILLCKAPLKKRYYCKNPTKDIVRFSVLEARQGKILIQQQTEAST